jgi:predicted RNase H-like HicB family nuclease
MIGNGSRGMELTVNIHLEDGSYWAEVPELPGCFASGDTLDELFSSVREGIRLYLDEENGSSSQSLHVRSAVLSDVAT